MATLNVIYRIASDISGLQDGVNRAAKSTEKLETMATRAGRTLTAAFASTVTVTAVASFTKQLVRTADELVKVADQTGLTTDEVQRLSFIAEQSGNSLGQLTNAVGQLQKRLVGGADSTVNAVKNLGLNFEALRKAAPFDQMAQIGAALAKIPDPAQRAALAVQLFGRAGVELLPTLIANFKELGDQVPVMSDKTVRALEQAGDAWNLFTRSIQVWVAESFNFAGRIFDEILANVYRVAAGFLVVTANVIDLAKKIPGASGPLKELGLDTDAMRKSAQDYIQTASVMIDKLDDVAPPAKRASVSVVDFGEGTDAAAKAQAKLTAELDKADAAYRRFTNEMGVLRMEQDALALAVDRVNASVVVGIPPMKQFAAAVDAVLPDGLEVDSLGDLAANLAQIGQEASVAGPRVLSLSNSLKSLLSGDFGQVFKDVGNFFKGGVTKIGTGFLESIGGGLFGMVSNLATAGIKKLGEWFGFIDSEADKARKLRQSLTNVAGGLDAVRVSALGAGASMRPLLDAKSVKAVEAAWRDLQEAIAFQDQAMQTLDATVAKYNFTAEEKGPAIALREQHAIAEVLYHDFRLLTAAGVDHAAIGREMAEATNLYVQNALKMGQDIPEFMRTQIEQMIDLGLLYDQNGNKIESLEDSGISFAESMTKSVNRLIDSVQKLVEAIDRGLGNAIKSIPDISVDVEADITVKRHYRDTIETEGSTHGDSFHQGGVVGAAMSNVLPFIPRAHNGLAVDEVPIIAQTGEGVLSRRGMAQIGGASGLNAINNGGGGGSLDLVSAIRSLKDRPVVVELVVDGQRFTRTVVKPNLDAEWERGGEGRRRSKKALQVA